MTIVVIDPYRKTEGSMYSWLFTDYGNISYNPLDIPTAKLVVFTGGEDVDPSLYGEGKRVQTNSNIKRDILEKNYFDLAKYYQIPMTGICRGAQFLCVMSGGKLYQHVTNHGSNYHTIYTIDGKKEEVNSLHHQMMIPRANIDTIMGWSVGISTEYNKNNYKSSQSHIGKDSNLEPEIVWFAQNKALAVQYHPEFMDKTDFGVTYYKSLLEHKFPNLLKED